MSVHYGASSGTSYGVGPRQQKERVKLGMKQTLIKGQIWQPIVMNWFMKWKEYVDYDNDGEDVRDKSVVEALHPGPIDNSLLRHTVGDELSRTVVQNKDYVLLPEKVALMLFDAYGPPERERFTFGRSVIDISGDIYNPMLLIELYPTRLEIYTVTNKQPNIFSKPNAITYSKERQTLDVHINICRRDLGIPYHDCNYRIWVRNTPKGAGPLSTSNNAAVNATAITEAAADSTGDASNTSACEGEIDANGGNTESKNLNAHSFPVCPTATGSDGVTRRLLTTDYTDMDGEWRLLRNLKARIPDLLGENEMLELILEISTITSNYGAGGMGYGKKEETWPRANILRRWKDDLRVGDTVDAQDAAGYKKLLQRNNQYSYQDLKEDGWYEAIITDVSPEGINVHFRPWGAEYDEFIPKSQIEQRIQPLYTKTPNWRASLDDGSTIELNVTAGTTYKPVWLEVEVNEIDKAKGRIEVKYSSEKKRKQIEQYGQLKEGVENDEEGTATKSEGEIRKEKLSNDNRGGDSYGVGYDMDVDEEVSFSPTHTKASAASSSSNAVVQDEVDTEVLQWVDIDSEIICDMYTHIEKPKNFNKKISGRSWDDTWEKHVAGKPVVKGAVGLRNLGNTCFMNSILQCLSNTPPLVEVFTSGRWKSQVNTDNPLGHGGKLAKSFANLMRDMWSDAYTVVVPRDFKQSIGEVKPEFAGYQQQDSQELLSFLLDGLHEDLNLVKRKPAVSKIESKGRPDEMIASEAWRRFLLRNDSELIKTCFGQYKSHLVCTCCRQDSVTFEPFSSLTLPIPLKQTKKVEVIVNLLAGPPLVVEIEVGLFDTIGGLKDKLIEKLLNLRRLKKPATPNLSTYAALMGDDETDVMTTDGSDDFVYVNKMDDNNVVAGIVVDDDDKDGGGDSDDIINVRKNAATNKTVATGPYSERVYRNIMSSPDTLRHLQASKDCFHISTCWYKERSRVSKSLEDSVPCTTLSSHSYSDVVIAFQLEHPAPLPQTSSYYNNYSTKENADTFMTCVDVCTGKVETTNYSNYSTYTSTQNVYKKVIHEGVVHRLAITKNTTGAELHKLVWKITKRFVDEKSMYYEYAERGQEYPFELIVCGNLGTPVKDTIAFDDTPLKRNFGTDILTIVWRPALINDSTGTEQFKMNELKRVDSMTQEEKTASEEEELGPLNAFKCLEKFTEKEEMGESDTWYCPKCKEHRVVVKKIDLWAVPDVLVIHLKRFQYVPGQYFVHREKIGDVIHFPIEGLDLTNHVLGPIDPSAPPIYDLYAVSNHMGGMNGGHYTAYCQNVLDKQWYEFDDTRCTPVSTSKVVSASAYVLFYRRRTGSLKWAGMKPLEVGMPDED